MKALIMLLVLIIPVNCFAHRAGYLKEIAKLKLGDTKEIVLQKLGMPDYSLGSIKGLEVLGYDVNRYRTSEEKGEILAYGIFTAGLAFFAVFFAENVTYSFIFDTNSSRLIEWKTTACWEDVNKYLEGQK